MNALKHGMTARVLVLPHEDEIEYHEIRAAPLESYAPANAHETMLVDGVAAGYWRTLRARRFDTALLSEGARTYKRNHDKSTEPNAGHDDSVCAVWMVQMPGEKLKNYFPYDGSIERQYYRAIAAWRKHRPPASAANSNSSASSAMLHPTPLPRFQRSRRPYQPLRQCPKMGLGPIPSLSKLGFSRAGKAKAEPLIGHGGRLSWTAAKAEKGTCSAKEQKSSINCNGINTARGGPRLIWTALVRFASDLVRFRLIRRTSMNAGRPQTLRWELRILGKQGANTRAALF